MNQLEKDVLIYMKNTFHNNKIEIKPNFSLKGLSSNIWKPDIVIIKKHEGFPRLIDQISSDVLAIIECKNVNSILPPTYRNQMMRAYAELGDLKNIKCMKFVIVPNKSSVGKFNYGLYFDSIQTELISWSDENDRINFTNIIKKVLSPL